MFDRLVEQKIRAALAEGEFDGLEGAGRPVDLEAYFATPEDLRAGFALLKNAGVAPEEVQMLKEIDGLKLELERCRDEATRVRLEKSLHDKALGFRMLMESRRGNKADVRDGCETRRLKAESKAERGGNFPSPLFCWKLIEKTWLRRSEMFIDTSALWFCRATSGAAWRIPPLTWLGARECHPDYKHSVPPGL